MTGVLSAKGVKCAHRVDHARPNACDSSEEDR